MDRDVIIGVLAGAAFWSLMKLLVVLVVLAAAKWAFDVAVSRRLK